MKIHCADIEDLAEVCAGLVKQGIKFRADTSTLVVTCTGGF